MFMDDFSVVADSFDRCLNNLVEMLKRCQALYLVLNWEKCHFMVKQGIALGHRISEKGDRRDLAIFEVIQKLSPTISFKGVRIFLGHDGFYRRFIKDFLKNAHPWCKLLEKYCKFYFDESRLKGFVELKGKLVSASIIISPSWGAPFQVMCDASKVAL